MHVISDSGRAVFGRLRACVYLSYRMRILRSGTHPGVLKTKGRIFEKARMHHEVCLRQNIINR